VSAENETGGFAGLSGEQLQGAIQSIMRDPAFSELLRQVQGSGGETAEKEAAPPPQMPVLTPEMMAKIPGMMAALSPLVSGMKTEQRDNGRPDSKAGDSERRKKLLNALRPYLSENRREAVDSILKVTEMTDLLGSLRLSGTNSEKVD